MQTGSYIGGRWIHPKSSRIVRNLNPADPSDVIAEFPSATAADVIRAVESAREAARGWRATPAPQRGRVLWRAADIARRRADEIARTMTLEEGKVLREARGEVERGIAVLEYNAGAGFRLGGRTLPAEARDTFTYTIRQPLGVVGLITPWNFPWAIPCWKSAPALVAGNAVVLKPSELTPATATLLTEIYEEAGVPAGVFNLVVGPGSEVGSALVDHPDVRAISFTGSNAVGQALYAQAARRGIRVTCEMGGKNAVVVMPDANLEKAAAAISAGAFASTGQRCTATSRVVAHPDVKHALIDRVGELAGAMKIGPGLDESSDLGPAVDATQLDTDLSYIGAAREEGARLVRGGSRVSSLPGYFVEPTIFDEVTPNMRIFREEVFGPVLAVSAAKDLDEAVRFTNSVDFGLSASIFTQNVDTMLRFVDEVEVGMVHVNEATVGGEAQLPFGGSKGTGVGEREMSEEGLLFFTELKTVFANYGQSGRPSAMR
jgi:alpha-ketoglutaric semialdehyde dehydrogenase